MRGSYPLEVRWYAESLVPQAQVRGNGDTILAHHGYDGATVILHDRLHINSACGHAER